VRGGARLEAKTGDDRGSAFEVTGHRPEMDLAPVPNVSVQRRAPNRADHGIRLRAAVALADGARLLARSTTDFAPVE